MRVLEKKGTKLVSKFSALGDATRYTLFQHLLKDDGICVSELANEVQISNAGVSQQLKIMEQAGIITRQREGQKICYRINRSNPENKKLLDLIQ